MTKLEELERLKYIVGICNNRWENKVSKKYTYNLLFKFYASGTDIETLERVAKLSFTWTDFKEKIELIKEKT